MEKMSTLFRKSILAFLVALFAVLSGVSLFVTCRVDTLYNAETVRLLSAMPFAEIPAALLLGAGLLLLCRKKRRSSFVPVIPGAAAVLFSIAFVLALGTRQRYDFEAVAEAARTFAQGNYKMLHAPYLNAVSYQLGVIFPMEVFARLFPFLDLQMSMQVLNVFFSAGIVWLLFRTLRLLFPEDGASGTAAFAALLFLPMLLNCVFVYGTLPMLLLILVSADCFVLLSRENTGLSGNSRILHALVCICAAGLACMLKPNAYIYLVALFLCSAIACIREKSLKKLLLPAASLALALLLSRGVIFQYELRSGVTLKANVGTKARLVMGMQDGPAAGWYNLYVERYFPLDVTKAQEEEQTSADLRAEIAKKLENPGQALRFYAEKLLTQWLDPTYGTVRYGQVSEHGNQQLADAVYADSSPLQKALSFWMKCSQLLFYVLAFIGLVAMLRAGTRAEVFLLPLTVFGGACYHMIFEAKSHYILVYVLLLAPVAMHGMIAVKQFFLRRLENRQSA